MSIKLNGATSGSIDIDVPAVVGGDVSLELPGGGTVDRLERAGNILQVKQVVKTDTASFVSTNTNTFQDLPGLSVSITPSDASNKILVLYNVNCAQSADASLHIRLMRGSTSVYQGDPSSNRIGSTATDRITSTVYNLHLATLSGAFLDSPSTTSATTYKLAGTLGATYSGTFYVNRAVQDTDVDYGSRTASSIIVMEVAA